MSSNSLETMPSIEVSVEETVATPVVEDAVVTTTAPVVEEVPQGASTTDVNITEELSFKAENTIKYKNSEVALPPKEDVINTSITNFKKYIMNNIESTSKYGRFSTHSIDMPRSSEIRAEIERWVADNGYTVDYYTNNFDTFRVRWD